MLTYTIRCGPGAAASVSPAVAGVGAKGACATTKAERTLLVEGPPQDVFCMQRFYGYERARITGHVDDATVDRSIGRSYSCAENMYRRLRPLVPPPASGRAG